MKEKKYNLTKKLFAILSVIIFISCKHKIHSGIIISKTYQESRTYTFLTPMMCGKSTIMIPHTGYDDEDFILTVESIKDKDTITENFYVNNETYNCMEKGYIFNDSVPCEREDDGLR